MKTIRKKITMTVEKTKTGFSAFSNVYPIYTTGKTIQELIDNAYEALELFSDDNNITLKSATADKQICK